MKISLPNRTLAGRRFLLAALLVLGAGCVTVEGKGESASSAGTPAAARPWTTAFLRPALLVADEIYLEGPDDLLDHVVITQDPPYVAYEMKTIEDGLLQELTIEEGSTRVEIRAQLDGWQIVAMKRLVVLQRPGEVPVLLRAVGEAWWSAADGSEEIRRDHLEFRGDRGR